jgi:hypothetical protein
MCMLPSPSMQDPLPSRPINAPGAGDVARLQAQVERLLIVTEALWTILREKTGLDEQELLRQMVQIDLRDGKLDGRVASTPPEPCPKCHRIVSKGAIRCLYCGEPLLTNPFAR